DQDWAAWESKLAAAREEQARLAHAAELSDTQRQQAMLNHNAQHFGPDEQLRAKTLLKLPRLEARTNRSRFGQDPSKKNRPEWFHFSRWLERDKRLEHSTYT